MIEKVLKLIVVYLSIILLVDMVELYTISIVIHYALLMKSRKYPNFWMRFMSL